MQNVATTRWRWRVRRRIIKLLLASVVLKTLKKSSERLECYLIIIESSPHPLKTILHLRDNNNAYWRSAYAIFYPVQNFHFVTLSEKVVIQCTPSNSALF